MLSASLLSTFHLLALAIGLPGVFLRGLALRDLQKDPAAIDRVFRADNAWGIAALLWIGTGLTRAFGPFEKGSGYYLHSGTFLVKMALFAVLFALEAWPMLTFIRWRRQRAKGLTLDTSRAGLFFKLNTAEVLLTLAMPFFASAMARGLGFGWFG
jgi:putative membrane protein